MSEEASEESGQERKRQGKRCYYHKMFPYSKSTETHLRCFPSLAFAFSILFPSHVTPKAIKENGNDR